MRPTTKPITAPTSTSVGVWPSSSRSRASWTPRMCTRSSTSRFSTSAWRPAARRSPAASYITTNVKISAIAKGAEERPEYLPIAVVRPITIALWLLGMPPVSASTRRLSRRARTEVMVTFAAWAMAQATIGARGYLTGPAIVRSRRPAPSAPPIAPAPRPAAARPAGAPPPARRAARSRPPASRSTSRGRPSARRAGARSRRGRRDATEDSVDEATGLVAGEGLGELDRLVDRRLGGHPAIDRDLVDGDAQDHTVHLRHLLELPVLRRIREEAVEPFLVVQDPPHQLAREVRDVLGRAVLRRVVAQHLLGIVACAFQLE